MALLICTGCGHPADEHHEGGCMEVDESMSEEGDVLVFCGCPRTPKALYDEAVRSGRVPGEG